MSFMDDGRDKVTDIANYSQDKRYSYMPYVRNWCNAHPHVVLALSIPDYCALAHLRPFPVSCLGTPFLAARYCPPFWHWMLRFACVQHAGSAQPSPSALPNCRPTLCHRLPCPCLSHLLPPPQSMRTDRVTYHNHDTTLDWAVAAAERPTQEHHGGDLSSA